MRTLNQVASFVAILVIWSQVIACDDKAHVDQSRFYGAWFPCFDETCEELGEAGIAFAANGWFYRVKHTAPAEPGAPVQFSFEDRECCWKVKGGDLILDLGTAYQTLEPRLEAEDVMQLESISFRVLDQDNQEWSVHECHEGDVFEMVDAGEDEEEMDTDVWTAEVCWTEHWAPIGRATRLLDQQEVSAWTFDPDEYIDSF